MSPLFLSADALDRLGITAAEVVASIEQVFARRARGKAWSAPKAVITPPDGRYIMSTLAVTDDPPLLACKALIVNSGNTERGLPAMNSLVTLLDGNTGVPVAVIDGNWITAVRTAGLSAVAAKRLARPASSVAAFIGCGVEARSHLEAFSSLFPLKEIRAFGRGSANRDALCDAAGKLGLRAIASPTARDAVTDADIVVTTVTMTPPPTPFLDARWLKPGAHAAMPDLGLPWLKESMPAFDRIVIDDLGQEGGMAKPLVEPRLVAGDIAGLVGGETAGRTTADEKTAFVFRGIALGDLALAALAYRRACGASSGKGIEP